MPIFALEACVKSHFTHEVIKSYIMQQGGKSPVLHGAYAIFFTKYW